MQKENQICAYCPRHTHSSPTYTLSAVSLPSHDEAADVLYLISKACVEEDTGQKQWGSFICVSILVCSNRSDRLRHIQDGERGVGRRRHWAPSVWCPRSLWFPRYVLAGEMRPLPIESKQECSLIHTPGETFDLMQTASVSCLPIRDYEYGAVKLMFMMVKLKFLRHSALCSFYSFPLFSLPWL